MSTRRRELSTIGVAVVSIAALSSATLAQPFGVERAIPERLKADDVFGGQVPISRIVEAGRIWFEAKFTKAEGAGRPGATGAIIPTPEETGSLPLLFRTAGADSNACRGCHNDPVTGGAGEFVSNAFVSEGFSDADFDTVDPQFSNERGTPALQGGGFVELLAREMTTDLRRQRSDGSARARSIGTSVTVDLTSKGVAFGRLTLNPDGFVDVSELQGVDQDLIVRPFSQKGVFTSLRQFTVNALNAHHGIQADERFGARHTGTNDFDRDNVSNEAGTGDVTALTLFQATLPPPSRTVPEREEHRAAVSRGETLFDHVGCETCHVSALPLESAVFTEPNPYNPAGNLREADVPQPLAIDLGDMAEKAGFRRDDDGRYWIPLYSDLKRHRIADDERPYFANELLSQRFVNRDEFLTPRLWGLGSTAPYGHRGDVTTIAEAIGHHGGEATESRRAFEALPIDDQRRIVAFLLTMRIVPEGAR